MLYEMMMSMVWISIISLLFHKNTTNNIAVLSVVFLYHSYTHVVIPTTAFVVVAPPPLPSPSPFRTHVRIPMLAFQNHHVYSQPQHHNHHHHPQLLLTQVPSYCSCITTVFSNVRCQMVPVNDADTTEVDDSLNRSNQNSVPQLQEIQQPPSLSSVRFAPPIQIPPLLEVDASPVSPHSSSSGSVVLVPTIYGMLECIPMTITIPIYDDDDDDDNPSSSSSSIPRIMKTMTTTIVEATASTQNQLVDYVLFEEQPSSSSDTTMGISHESRNSNISNSNSNSRNQNNNNDEQRPRIQDPYGAVLWPAAQAVTSYLLSYSSRRNCSTSNSRSHSGNRSRGRFLELLWNGNNAYDDQHHHYRRRPKTKLSTTSTTTTIQRTQIIELGCGTGLISLSLYRQAMDWIQNQSSPPNVENDDDISNTSTTASTTTNRHIIMYDISIVATDYEMVPLQLVQYAAQTYIHHHHLDDDDDCDDNNHLLNNNSSTSPNNNNTALTSPVQPPNTTCSTYRYNNHTVSLQTQLFDVCNMSQPLPIRTLVVPENDDDDDDDDDDDNDTNIHIQNQILIVVADLLYEKVTALALAQRILHIRNTYKNENIQIIIGDSPGRIGRPVFLEELQKQHWKDDTTANNNNNNNNATTTTVHAAFMKTTMVLGQTMTTPRNELICGPTSKSISSTNDPKSIEIDILHI